MFDFFKRKAKPSASATDESKPLWVELFDTQPVDSEGSLMRCERVLVDELGLVVEYLIGAEVVSASIDGVALVKAQPPSTDLAKLGLWEAFKLWREERKRARSGGDGM